MAAEYYKAPEVPTHPPAQPDGSIEPRPEGVPMHSHEGTDVKIRPLAICGVILVVVLALSFIGMGVLHRVFEAEQASYRPAESALSGVVKRSTPTTRPLQGIPGYHGNTPAQDMQALAAQNRASLKGYGPSPTKEPGYVRIPIDRAMQIALKEKRFKTAPALTTPPSGQRDRTPGASGREPTGTQRGGS